MKNTNKLFGLQEEVQKERDAFLQKKKVKRDPYIDNAVKSITFSGKRFLGKNSAGRNVWIELRLDKSSLDLDISTNYDLNSLLENGARLAMSRLSRKINSRVSSIDIDNALKIDRKNAGGMITPARVKYIQKLQYASELKSRPAFIDEKPTKLFFQYAASCIYPGDLNETTGFRWHDVASLWPLPSGEYFTMEIFPQVRN